MIKNSVTTVILILAGFSIACTSTGADHKQSAPVNSVSTPKSNENDSISQADSSKTDRQNKELTIAMCGDIMMGTTYPNISLPADSGKALFNSVKKIFLNADLSLGNLEGTLCDSGETTKRKSANNYAFRTPTYFAPRLSEVGFDFLSMANNHAFDFGLSGVRSTEHALDDENIAYAGLKCGRHSVVIERNGLKIGLCAFGHNGYTLKHQDLSVVKEIIDSLKKSSDIVVVSFHGGAEGRDKSHLPQGKETFLGEDRGSLRSFAHYCIDNGADVIYGHGPHVVRCAEIYKNRFIAYSLGNFCTPYGINTAGISGYAPIIEIKTNSKGAFLEGQIHSFIQKRGIGPRPDTTNSVAKQIKSLTCTDIQNSAINISDEGKITIK